LRYQVCDEHNILCGWKFFATLPWAAPVAYRVVATLLESDRQGLFPNLRLLLFDRLTDARPEQKCYADKRIYPFNELRFGELRPPQLHAEAVAFLHCARQPLSDFFITGMEASGKK
jgi:hypothetical protein